MIASEEKLQASTELDGGQALEGSQLATKKKLWKKKYTFYTGLVALLVTLFLILYLPGRYEAVAAYIQKIFVADRSIPKQIVGASWKWNIAKAIIPLAVEAKIVEPVRPQGVLERVRYNFGYLYGLLASKGDLEGFAGVLAVDSPATIKVRYRLAKPRETFKSKGRTIREVDITIAADKWKKVTIKNISPVSYFDEYDAKKLMDIFKATYDDSRMSFRSKYNKLLNITRLADQYYRQIFERTKYLTKEQKDAYLTYSLYNQQKNNPNADFSRAELTELIRCYLYDTAPPVVEGRLQIAPLLTRLKQARNNEIKTDTTYQIQMLMEKYAAVMSNRDLQQLILVLVGHPGVQGHERLKRYMLEANPGIIVEVLDSINENFLQQTSNKRELAQGLIDILSQVYRQSHYVSVKRQTLITLNRLKAYNSSKVNDIIRNAKHESDPRLRSTADSL